MRAFNVNTIRTPTKCDIGKMLTVIDVDFQWIEGKNEQKKRPTIN